ncbi:MAG: ABC transporter ATP-binding protein, partial [Treponema sp.]|nr:ABC transporter ATP-binding protein [Treponema sp.]
TAAIDPIEETRVYRQFAAIAREITAVIVTHRLGSARIADRILVMDEGRIVESGGHEELVRRGGKYAQMWAAQAKYY